jgi:UDP-N-acetylmuramyl pentapeptide phosphotransferase/UDP-N-acetylglucosamine-1-phosphate transferase
MDKQYIIMFLTALIVSLAITPIVIKFARKIGALDIPNDNRRVHKVPIPLIGGLGIYAAFALTIVIFLPLTNQIRGILLGSTFIMACGLVDDLKPLKPRVKLMLQVIGSLILVYFGVRIRFVTNPFDNIVGMSDVGWLSIPATVFWIVGVTNAFNLIDGLDGLAAGIAFISCITLFVVSITNERMTAVFMTSALAGSTLGFLPYNFNPAKIFMGDTGAQFLGFVLAAISIQGAIKSAAAIVITVPILALGLPIYDTLIAMVRRFINKRPVMEADRGHLHHKLLDMGLNQKQAVLVMYSISGLLGVSAILAMELTTVKSFIILLSVICVVFVLAKQMGLFSRKNQGD